MKLTSDWWVKILRSCCIRPWVRRKVPGLTPATLAQLVHWVWQAETRGRCRRRGHIGLSCMNILIEKSAQRNWYNEIGANRPPPSVNPATPIPVARAPITFTPSGSKAAYTSSQINPAPTFTVWLEGLYSIWEKRYMEMWTPSVEENPTLVMWPPPLT